MGPSVPDESSWPIRHSFAGCPRLVGWTRPLRTSGDPFLEAPAGSELRVEMGSDVSGQDVPGHLLQFLAPVVSFGRDTLSHVGSRLWPQEPPLAPFLPQASVQSPAVPGRSPRAEPGLGNGPQVLTALANQPWVHAPSLWLVSDTHCPSPACCPPGGPGMALIDLCLLLASPLLTRLSAEGKLPAYFLDSPQQEMCRATQTSRLLSTRPLPEM